MTYPLRHISIRVPWHDTAWDGRVCAAPRLNGACLKLRRIAEDRDDAAEEAVAGKSLKDLPQKKWPACMSERVGFRRHSNTRARPHTLTTVGPKPATVTLRRALCGIHLTRRPQCRLRGC